MHQKLVTASARVLKPCLRIALSTVALVTVGYAQTFDTAKGDLLLNRLFEKNKGMGSVAMAKDGRIVYSHAFGYARVADAASVPATAETKYRIASITKTYTAVMVFQLVEEGRLRLADTLDRFFPEIPNANRITIAHLLAHRSGVPDLPPDGSWGRQFHSQREIVSRIAQGSPLFEPDAQHLYSNTGYILLGYIVESAGGKPYAEALTNRITSKIGAANTYVGTGRGAPANNEAVSYRYPGRWEESAELDFSVPAGAGAILSTPTDMVRFIRALFDLKLVSAESLKQMTTIRDGEGMGLEPFTFGGKTFFGHTGGSGSSGAWLAYSPDEKLALAYATNAKIYPVINIVSGLFDIYWNRPFDVPTFDVLELAPALLDRYVGTYATAAALAKMMVSRQGGTLYVQPTGQNAVPLEAVSENIFKIDPGVFFEFDAAKAQLTIKRPQGERVFTKER